MKFFKKYNYRAIFFSRYGTLLISHAGALFTIFAFLFLMNNFVGKDPVKIKSDGEGYYDYLPALFIYGDLPLANSPTSFERINKLVCYPEYNGKRVNKYSCGTALLLFPFFVYAHLTAPLKGYRNDGFSEPYHKAVYYAMVFYLFLSLMFLGKLLALYGFSRLSIFIVVCLAVLSTSIVHYASFDASFSHVYSFFAICAFFFFTKAYFLNKKTADFIYASAFLGLIIILRPLNLIILFFLPFLAGSFQELKNGAVEVIKKPSVLFKGFALFFAIVFIQMYLWYLQTGKFLIYSYPGESFNFLSPAFIDILFSYRKGLFVYTPVTFLALGGLFFLIKERNYYLFFSWITFFILITYILSSWWSWYYGCSYGLRAYIDFYPVFFILLALLLDRLSVWLKSALIFLCLITIPINIIQTWQYKEYILHWIDMDRQKYWMVFLKTDDKYKGLLWKRRYNFNTQNTVQAENISLGDFTILPNQEKEIYLGSGSNIPDFNKVNLIQVRFDNDFSEKEDARVELKVVGNQNGEVAYAHKLPLIHFFEDRLNKFHTGEFNYELGPFENGDKKVAFMVYSKNTEVSLKNVKVSYLIRN